MNSGNLQKGRPPVATTAIEPHGPRNSYRGKIVPDARCIRNYQQGQGLSRVREGLTNAIDRVAGNEQ